MGPIEIVLNVLAGIHVPDSMVQVDTETGDVVVSKYDGDSLMERHTVRMSTVQVIRNA